MIPWHHTATQEEVGDFVRAGSKHHYRVFNSLFDKVMFGLGCHKWRLRGLNDFVVSDRPERVAPVVQRCDMVHFSWARLKGIMD